MTRSRNRRWQMSLVLSVLVAVAVTAVAVPSGLGGNSGATQSGKLDAILLNPFIGNDWRPQMQKYAEVVVTKPPLNARYNGIRIVTTQNNDPSLQAPALQSAILENPDVIVMIAASQTATNGLIQQACARGILVVGFDTYPTAPCAWKLALDWYSVGRSWADWVVRSIGRSGKVFVDRGVPGNAASVLINKGIDSVLKANPRVKAYTYLGKFSPGEETKAVSQLLAAHPDVKGVISAAYGAQDSLRKAKLRIPASGFNYPSTMQSCVQANNPCYLIASPPWISADALRLAAQIKAGQVKGKARFVPFAAPLYVHNTKVRPLTKNLGAISQLRPALRSAPKGAFLPASPPWVKINFQKEILD